MSLLMCTIFKVGLSWGLQTRERDTSLMDEATPLQSILFFPRCLMIMSLMSPQFPLETERPCQQGGKNVCAFGILLADSQGMGFWRPGF